MVHPSEIVHIYTYILLIIIILFSINIIMDSRKIKKLKKEIQDKSEKIAKNNTEIFQKNSEIYQLNAKLKFALRTSPKFKVGDKIGDLTVCEVRVKYNKYNLVLKVFQLAVQKYRRLKPDVSNIEDLIYYEYIVKPTVKSHSIEQDLMNYLINPISEKNLIKRQELIKKNKKRKTTKK